LPLATISKAKIYEAGKVGKSAAAEKKMQEVVTAIVAKEPDFVSDKSAVGKGYTNRAPRDREIHHRVQARAARERKWSPR